MGGWSCDRWEAQWQLSTITAISYGRRIDKEDRKGMQSGSVRGGVVKLGDVGRGQRWVKEGRDVESGSREEVEKNCKEEYGKGMQRGGVKGGLVIWGKGGWSRDR